jgi:hypothetical protein
MHEPMLSEFRINAASRTLHDHWRAGTKLAGLEEALRPRNRAEAYAVQEKIETCSKAKLFGWKIAATSEAGQKHINVDGPMAGRILSETVISDGGTAAMAGNEMRVADRDSGFTVRRFCQRGVGADHRGQCLRTSVCAGRADYRKLARAGPRRGEACHHDARKAIHRPRQERARRSQDRPDVARQRIAAVRRDAAGRRGGDDRHLSSTAADPARRRLRG